MTRAPLRQKLARAAVSSGAENVNDIKGTLDAHLFRRSGRVSSRLFNAMILNDYSCPLPRFAWQLRVGCRSNQRLVPQVFVNRRVKLASPRQAAQPNYALDRVWAKRIPDPVQNGNAGRETGLEKGKTGREIGHEKGVHPAGCTPSSQNRLRPDQAFGAASALTREVRRDILREAVFLCSTPLVTPRISSG